MSFITSRLSALISNWRVRAFYIFAFVLVIGSMGCRDTLPVIDKLTVDDLVFNDQNNIRVHFPSDFSGYTTIVSFIFTNCPDICPMATHNITQIQEKVKSAGLKKVRFVSITFDPERDNPEVFRKYIEVRGLDTKNWQFLTSDRKTTEKLMKMMHIVAIPSDTTLTEDKDKIYFFNHTDRFTLLDSQFRVRGEFSGSKPNIDKIIEAIKNIGE